MAGDELFDQHPIQGDSLRAGRAVLQPAQGGGAGQISRLAYRRLHQDVAAQAVVVVQVFVAHTQAVDALGQHGRQGVGDARCVARIVECGGNRTGQADALVPSQNVFDTRIVRVKSTPPPYSGGISGLRRAAAVKPEHPRNFGPIDIGICPRYSAASRRSRQKKQQTARLLAAAPSVRCHQRGESPCLRGFVAHCVQTAIRLMALLGQQINRAPVSHRAHRAEMS